MASGKYKKFCEEVLQGQIDLIANDIKVVLIDTAFYTPNLTTDQFLSDIPAGARVAISPSLSGKSVAAGVFDAADPVFASVAGGTTCEAIAFFKDTGVVGTSPLIYYADNYTNLPVTTNGANITVVLDNTADKIFAL